MRFKQVSAPSRWTDPTDAPLAIDAVVENLRVTREHDVPIYVSMGDYFVYGVFVPTELLSEGFEADIIGWNMSAPRGYGYGFDHKEGRAEPCLFGPLEHTGSTILDRGIAPLFARFDRLRGAYVEPNQQLTHVLDLHHVESKGCWCRRNELGEHVPILRVDRTDARICTLDRDALDLFLVASKTTLVRVVDVTKRSLARGHQTTENGPVFRAAGELSLRTYTASGKVLAARGFDLLGVSAERATRALLVMQGKAPREYASFITQDFKHERVAEVEADPSKIGNYFVPSDLPYGTSPVFFKPDVLVQYRADPSRFRVLPDRVECIGAWSLPYHVNEEGQVHAYLVDLAALPYQEQLGWKRWNEAPKGPIAELAWRQDFQGEWTTDYDPLLSLCEILTSFPATDTKSGCVAVWSLGELPPTRNLDFLGYVVTESQKEFEDQILALNQIVIEGLDRGQINRLGDALGCRDDKQLGSIKQLGKVMSTLGVAQKDREAILGPLLEIQARRSSSVAHRGTSTLECDQRVYFRELLARCDTGMRKLAELVTNSTFVLPRPSGPPR